MTKVPGNGSSPKYLSVKQRSKCWDRLKSSIIMMLFDETIDQSLKDTAKEYLGVMEHTEMQVMAKGK